MRVAVDATIKTIDLVQRARRHAQRAGRPHGPRRCAPRLGAPRGRASTTTAAARPRSWRRRCRWPKLGIKPTNRVRFAFWGGEEDGLIGSDYYVSQLDARALKQHAVNLNFDMVGSPNFVRFVYDGDGSAFGTTGPNGSARVEQVFLDYFASQGLADRADRVRRSLRLLRLHQQRHPRRRPVHRRRGHQDRRRGGDLRRHGGRRLRPVLPPGLRHHRQPRATRRSTRCPTPSPTAR